MEEQNAEQPRELVVINKVDVADPVVLTELHHALPEAVFVSAVTGQGMDEFMGRIMQIVASGDTEVTLVIPFTRGDVVSRVHAAGAVIDEQHTQDGTRIVVRLPASVAGELEQFVAVDSRDGAA